MRRLFYTLICIISCSVVFLGQSTSTTAQSPAVPKYRELDAEFHGPTYTNHYFGFTFTLPDKWISHDQETQLRLLETGNDAIKDPDLKKVEAGPSTGFFILVLTSPADRMVPQISLMSQDVLSIPQIKTGEDFVKLMRDQFAVKEGYRISGDVRALRIGGKDFYVGEMFNGAQVHQAVISTIIKRHALTYIVTATTDEDFKTLMDSVGQMKFLEK
jgi:hypothetical protein